MSKKKKIIAIAIEDTFLKESPQHSSIEGNTKQKVYKGQKILFTPKQDKDGDHLKIRYIQIENEKNIIPIAYIWKKHWNIEK